MNGLGGLAKGVSDFFGLPPVVGEIASLGVNALTGNIPGVVQDGIELMGGGHDSKGGGNSFTAPSAPAVAKPAGPDKAPIDPKQLLKDFLDGKQPEGMSDEQFVFLQVQHQLEEMNMKNSMVSAMLKSEHDTKMEIVRNMKV